MAYLGRQPIVGNYQVLDALTATTTDTYALTKNSVAVFPQTPANCIVSLNGVIQAPFSSYTISASNIIFASALTASDSIDFITVLGDVLNVGTVSDGTITTAKLANTSVTPAKMDLSQNYTFTGAVSGHNYPAFFIIKSSTQAISASTLTKVTFDGTLFDTDSGFDNTNDRWTVPTGKAGKYYLSLALGHTNSIAQNADLFIEMRRYNSSNTIQQYQLKSFRQGASSNHYGTYNMDTIWDCSVGDYFQIHFFCSDACDLDGNALESGLSYSNAEHTSFIGYRIGA